MVNTMQSDTANAGLMLGHRLRRWPNIKPALDQEVWCLLLSDQADGVSSSG